MKTIKFLNTNSLRKLLGALFGVFGVLCILTAGQARAAGEVLQFTANAGNSYYDWTYLNSSVLNHKKNLKLIVTQYWTGTYNPVPVGVFYTSGTWAVFNQDTSAIPAGSSFNVQVVSETSLATPLNSAYTATYISPGYKNPNAVLLFTPLWGYNYLIGGVYVDDNQGVSYTSGLKRWAIVNEDGAPARAAAYNVIDVTKAPKHASSFLLTTTASNIDGGDGVYIDNAISNSNPEAVVFVSPVLGTTWNHPVGVYYSSPDWEIFNEDEATMPAGLTFNVEVFNGPLP